MAEGGDEEDKSQLIAHFQEITGIEDEARILQHLGSHQWDLETAVQDALNEREGRGSVYGASSSSGNLSPLGSPPLHQSSHGLGSFERHGHREQAVVRREGWLEWGANLAIAPLRFILSGANELFQLIVSLLFGSEPAQSQNPHQDALTFVQEFEQKFGTAHPPFLIKSYDEALTQARKDLQFLLVYIHSPGHQDTTWFCKEALSSPRFIDFISSNRILCLGVSVKSEEGVRVSYIMRENTYPFLALVVLKQGRLVVCERVEGALPLDELLNRLRTAMTDNEGELVVERTERLRRLEDQRLREAQDQAFQESLAADREKERQREEDQSRADRLAREQQEVQEQQQKAKEDFEVEKALRASRLPPEPEPGDPAAMQVMLRMPSGHRLERWFRGSDKLQSVYDFAYSDESGQLPMSFTLVANFPRKELVTSSDGGPMLEELNLGKRCALFVQDDAA